MSTREGSKRAIGILRSVETDCEQKPRLCKCILIYLLYLYQHKLKNIDIIQANDYILCMYQHKVINIDIIQTNDYSLYMYQHKVINIDILIIQSKKKK